MSPKQQETKSHLLFAHSNRPLAAELIVCSPEVISDLIGAIYDCVLAPEKWGLVLETINRELRFVASFLGISPLRPGAQITLASAGVDPAWLSVMPNYQTEVAAGWGGPERMAQYPLDEPVVASQIKRVRWEDNRYSREVTKPRGIIDAVGISVAREPSLLGYVAFSRHQSAGAIGELEVNTLRLLGPHFRRAVTISNLFDLKTIEAATFSAVFDSFAFGMVLVDAQLGIVHANRAASDMLAVCDPIESQKGVLATRELAANGALERAVRLAAEDETTMGARGIGIPARRVQGDPCVIHVLPLKRAEIRRGLSQRATAALFIAPAIEHARLPMDALALLYDLTPAEKRICELIAEGHPQAEIATILGIGRATVKTHVLRIFDKTGCRRQADLMKLAGTLRLPV